MLQRALFVAVSLVLAGCEPECGAFRFTVPQTTAFYAQEGQPELATPSSGFEWCGRDFGSQGSWTRGALSFAPSGGRSAASFSDLMLEVRFSPAEATTGATLTASRLQGQAFTGLGLTHRDVAERLEPDSTLTFHAVGGEQTEDAFTWRVVELSWQLVWSNDAGGRYEAKGRDQVDFFVD